jgi:hypothetical protein
MMGVSLVMAVTLLTQTVSQDDPRLLVDRLGSSRYAEREAAARSLQQRGRDAIPALQGALESRDLEVRTRAQVILQKIEGAILTEPTLVWLNFKDVPLNEVVRALSQRTGMKISLFPESLPRWNSERISLQESEPLPFWKAIDRLCVTASLQNDLELHGFATRSEATLALTDRITRPVHPVFDHGPFRVSLVGLEFQRNVGFAVVPPRPRGNPGGRPGGNGPRGQLAPPQPRPVTSVQCSVQLQVTAEPRLGISQNGLIQILEARDELGNSLIVPGQGAAMLSRTSGYLGGTCNSVVHVRSPLHRPDNPGRTIKTLRGAIPLKINARQPDPLIVPLAGATGKSFDKGDLHLVVHEIRSDPNNRQRQIELSVRQTRSVGLPTLDDATGQDFGARPDRHQQNIEVRDARGRVLPWIQTSVDLESARITLTMAGLAGTEPNELRYYQLAESTLNVPFQFADVPMP